MRHGRLPSCSVYLHGRKSHQCAAKLVMLLHTVQLDLMLAAELHEKKTINPFFRGKWDICFPGHYKLMRGSVNKLDSTKKNTVWIQLPTKTGIFCKVRRRTTQTILKPQAKLNNTTLCPHMLLDYHQRGSAAPGSPAQTTPCWASSSVCRRLLGGPGNPLGRRWRLWSEHPVCWPNWERNRYICILYDKIT